MAAAFGPARADFSAMSPTDLFVNEVKHKAVVDVNEEGTEAAAVTSVEIGTDMIPNLTFDLVVDRPFFFAIRDDAVGSILFMGAVWEPEE